MFVVIHLPLGLGLDIFIHCHCYIYFFHLFLCSVIVQYFNTITKPGINKYILRQTTTQTTTMSMAMNQFFIIITKSCEIFVMLLSHLYVHQVQVIILSPSQFYFLFTTLVVFLHMGDINPGPYHPAALARRRRPRITPSC